MQVKSDSNGPATFEAISPGSLQSRIVIEVSTGIAAPDGETTLRNALEAAEMLRKSGSEVRLVFDGAGTTWLSELSSRDHPLNRLFLRLMERVPVACGYCAQAFGVEKQVHDAGLVLVDYHGPSSFTDLIWQNYETFTY